MRAWTVSKKCQWAGERYERESKNYDRDRKDKDGSGDSKREKEGKREVNNIERCQLYTFFLLSFQYEIGKQKQY